MISIAFFILKIAFSFTTISLQHQDAGPTPAGMVWVPAGEFTMGSNASDARPDESPAHQVTMDGFWIDATEVTNAQFKRFVEATQYKTTAEKPVNWEELKKQVPPNTPKPPEEMMGPGSLVFIPPPQETAQSSHLQWWSWVPHASWHRPGGPGTSIEGMDNYPVVHISWEDANAYAQWAGKKLPTEAQWERAARYNADGQSYSWGNELEPNGVHMANIWQGEFPSVNTASDGFAGIAPVKQFAPNASHIYDMAGNVWEWTADRYQHDLYAIRESAAPEGQSTNNPIGPDQSLDPRNPHALESRVQKGGSFLCHANYCSSYRPSARMSTTPDTSLSHSGFRCVLIPEPTPPKTD